MEPPTRRGSDVRGRRSVVKGRQAKNKIVTGEIARVAELDERRLCGKRNGLGKGLSRTTMLGANEHYLWVVSTGFRHVDCCEFGYGDSRVVGYGR